MGRKLGLDRVLDCFSLSLCSSACACVHSVEEEEQEDEDERKALVSSQLEELVKLSRDLVGGAAKTLAFHLEPKVGGRTGTTIYLSISLETVSDCVRAAAGLHYSLLSFWLYLPSWFTVWLFRPWSSRCPCTATGAPRRSRSTSPRWTV
jgi:hypothetical protein|uniref:Uncharacterized protein n=1 Tax=Zea mays TaxID=4577 RepID=C4JBM8_MAIZE|nr:unknown [Zea mays]